MTADLILHNGRIYTVDTEMPWASAVAIKGSWFTAVGDDDEVMAQAGQNTEIVNLAGKMVLPGLCDAHIHFYDWSLSQKQAPVAGCVNKQEMMAKVQEWVIERPAGSWVVGRGWNENLWDTPELPTRDDLDQVTGLDNPTLLWRVDMHAAVANSAALRLAGISSNSSNPKGGRIGRDDNGRPTGMLWELAINLVQVHMPKPGPEERMAALMVGMGELHRLGITTVHDQRMKDQDEGPLALDTYQRLCRDGRLKLRVNCNVAAHDLDHLSGLGLRGGFGNDYLRLGHVKLFADGTMGSRTAWMLAPFEPVDDKHDGDLGVNVTPPEQMLAEMQRAATLGFPISVHAIGDRANRVVVELFEELASISPRPAIPHRIEHVQILDPADEGRLGAADITASVQPVHALDDMEVAEWVLGFRAANVYKFRSLANAGTRLALGSDAPVADPNPFLGLHAAVYRQRPEQMGDGPWYGEERLSLEQAIKGYTIDAARAAGWEKVIGTITAGKRADLIVLDRDLFKLADAGVQGREIVDTKVELTLFDGKTVYKGRDL